MGQSLRETVAASPVEDDTEKTSFCPDGRHHYEIERNPEGVFHHERLTDADGQTVYDQKIRIEFVLGSGSQGHSYLIDRGGQIFLSPIGWYGRAERWDLSPGYKLPVHQRFGRTVTSACLECHTGSMNQVAGRENRFENPPFQELSIGCERCHGPAAGHIRYHHQPSRAGEPDPIVNPARLDPARREDVCSQCHLQGEARSLRDGCQFGDFRPGQRLEDVYLIFVRGTRTTGNGKTQAVSQVEQMRSSACYLKSEGRFGCTSCHDSHSQPARRDRDAFYRQKCLACHSSRGCSLPEAERVARRADDSCIACHLPRLDASDVPHTTQADHRILRTHDDFAGDAEPLAEMAELFDGAEQRLPRLVVDRARGIWLAERAEMKSDRPLAARAFRLLIDVSRQRPGDADVLNALGTACALEGRLEDSLRYWKQAVEIDPNRELTLLTTASVLLNTGRHQEARPLLERYLQIQPWNGGAWSRYAGLLGQLNEIDKAIEAGLKSIEVDPSNPKTYRLLARLYGRVGNEQQRQRYSELSRRIRPDNAPQ